MKTIHFRLVSVVLVLSSLALIVYAHPGRTDSHGGHTDRSAGEYHYHHGYPEHDHSDLDGDGNLDCPYDFDDQTGALGESNEPAGNKEPTSGDHLTETSSKQFGFESTPSKSTTESSEPASKKTRSFLMQHSYIIPVSWIVISGISIAVFVLSNHFSQSGMLRSSKVAERIGCLFAILSLPISLLLAGLFPEFIKQNRENTRERMRYSKQVEKKSFSDSPGFFPLLAAIAMLVIAIIAVISYLREPYILPNDSTDNSNIVTTEPFFTFETYETIPTQTAYIPYNFTYPTVGSD